MQTNKMIRATFVTGLVALAAYAQGKDRVVFTAKVVDDETLKPIPEVEISGFFEMNHGWDAVLGSAGPNLQSGKTDAEGRCRMEGKTNLGRAGFRIASEVPGYLWNGRCTMMEYKKKNMLGDWLPQERELTIGLMRATKSVPLLVDKVMLLDQPLGSKTDGRLQFDFMVGDWLPPYGKGLLADLEFIRRPVTKVGEYAAYDGSARDRMRSEVEVRFLGTDNGLVEVEAFPDAGFPIQSAPEGGFESRYLLWQQHNQTGGSESNLDECRCFCFRIRAKRGDDGKLMEANYGKIHGDFQPVNSGAIPWSGMMFTYYVNTNNLDRGLLFDTKRNLRHSRWGDNFPQ